MDNANGANEMTPQLSNALAQAMDTQRPFSWVIDRPARGITRGDVQAGVYLKLTQPTWAQMQARKVPSQW